MYSDDTKFDTYWNARLDRRGIVAANDASTKTKALVEATQLINNLNFEGEKLVSTQDDEFPRLGATDVPQAIEDAANEMAYHILDGRDVEFELENLETSGLGVQSMRKTSRQKFISDAKAHGIPSEKAWRYLKPFLRDGQTFKMNRIS